MSDILPVHRPTSWWMKLVPALALIVILLIAGYFRFVGLMWGDYSYPHPDERFLVWVVADITPVHNLGEYFNTATSTLNPANRGHAFYVYGDFPVVFTRYVTSWVFDQVGWDQILQTGRALSAFFDLLTVLLVFQIVERLAGWKAAVLAGLLSAAVVLEIQQAHFFTSDTFSTFFTTLAIYVGMLLVTESDNVSSNDILALSLVYGLAVGMAMACKINTAPVALLLPVALFIRWLRQPAEKRISWEVIGRLVVCAVLAGAVAALVFRVGQPYAFSGPGFFNVSIDTRWLASIRDLQAQSSGDVDFPPALQWAGRNHLFSLQNMVIWGLGVPLGVAGWAGFVLYALRTIERLLRSRREPAAGSDNAEAVLMPLPVSAEQVAADGITSLALEPEPVTGEPPAVDEQDPQAGLSVQPADKSRWAWVAVLTTALLQGPWPGVLLVWLWTAFYFTWQSLAWNPTMRYQLPVYPMLAVLAAWGLANLWEHPRLFKLRAPRPHLWRTGVGVAAVFVVLLTLAWAFAFIHIYTRTETRVAASQWIFANVPGPVNLEGQSTDGKPWNQLLSVSEQANIHNNQTYQIEFNNRQAGALDLVSLQQVHVSLTGTVNGDSLRLHAQIIDPIHPEQIGQAEVALPPTGSLDKLDLPAAGLPRLVAGRRYELILSVVQANGDPLPADSGVMVTIDGPVTLNLFSQVDSASYQMNDGGLVNLVLPNGGTLRQVRLPQGTRLSPSVPVLVTVILKDPLSSDQQVASGTVDENSPDLAVRINQTLSAKPGVSYLLAVVTDTPIDIQQPIQLDFLDQPVSQALPDLGPLARKDVPLYLTFTAHQSGALSRVMLDHTIQLESTSAPTGLTLSFYANGDMTQAAAQSHLNVDLNTGKDPRGPGVTFTFDQPVTLSKDQNYAISLVPDDGVVALHGSAVANESTWDMGLPFRQDNYDPFGGIYRGDLNFEMYWDDNPEKLQRFLNNLDQADYIFMSSGRQWGTTTRVPERYPLTTEFYRRLLGCPADRDVVWCYRVAEPGMFQGDLGFDLVKVVTSYPGLGPVQINDQFAEEAFTVYDHAKVMIFRKNGNYSTAQDQAILGAVDLNQVVHVTPKKAGAFKDLLLTPAMALIQQAGGTWAALFPPEGLLNRLPGVGAVVWYLFLLVLGVMVYPLVRLALHGLPDRGYPLVRIVGLVIFGYLAWILGSVGLPVTRLLLAVLFILLALLGIGAAYLQRDELRAEWRERRRYFLSVEMVALVLFAIDLLIRLGNPDLWHLYYGGEKPMDFSFFNAVMKSSIFPPYDPWFGGGYINYYYYGYVLVGMPVKLLGINPTVAYNLVLPALFSMVGLGAFCVGWNVFAGGKPGLGNSPTPNTELSDNELTNNGSTKSVLSRRPFWPGIVAVFALLLLGNLGVVRMYWQGLQLLVVSQDEMNAGNFGQHLTWAGEGISKMVSEQGTRLPYSVSDWYWKPSRAIQPEAGNEITEFPFFTFLYADLHAHLMALPVTILVIAWALAIVLGGGRWGLRGGRLKKTSLALALLIGGLAAGALRPANTWDQYTYLTLAALALMYGQYRAGKDEGIFRPRWVNVLVPPLVLVALAILMYYPFDAWFAQGYNSLEIWQGARTGLPSYLVQWGLFLFVITAWLFDETVDWMAATPLAALRGLKEYREIIYGALALMIIALIGLMVRGVWIGLIVVPLGFWATVLLFRPDLPDSKRFVLFMIGTALLLTLAVELVAVKGDIGRMNTVFKFYYQAWTLLSLSAAAALAWLWGKLRSWQPVWETIWTVGLVMLVAGCALYPMIATQAKIEDRMAADAPHTLDGMAFMDYARLLDGQSPQSSIDMDLSQDFRAIHWAQANIPGSPIIVEANTPEYRHWGTRFTIYTGLPGVVGWNWHERQQRTITPDTWVYQRIDDITAFYQTTDPAQAKEFLQKYHVQYIIFGQIEKAWYPGPGLNKFEQLNGKLWDRVYQNEQTAIYKVK
jgi:YYY domain-containing protein